jgi:hypothetical protein
VRYLIKHYEKRTQGNIAIEAAILMPIFLGILLFFISILQIAAARNLLELSLIKTADEICRWAPIYRNMIRNEFQEEIYEELSDTLKEFLPTDNGSFPGNILQLQSTFKYSSYFIYKIAAQSLCSSYVFDDPFVENKILKIHDLNLYKSNLFQNGTDKIRVTGTCMLDTYLPFAVQISFSIYCSAWGAGRTPQILIPDSEASTSGIWNENNFTRGKIFRKMYGGNLPDFFPVIAAFENGTAIMIKSLNHTMQSYQNSNMMEKTIRDMIDTLAFFDGAEYGEIIIGKHEILQRKLILILPENELTVSQEAVIRNMMQYSMLKFVMLDLQRYQKV